MFTRYIIFILLAFSLAGCGDFDAANQTDTDNLSPLIFPDLEPGDTTPVGEDDPFPSSGSIFTILTDFHSSLAGYDEVEMELDLGTVIGTHGSLDSRQGGDITLHFRDGSDRYIRSFTSGGNTLEDVERNFWYVNSNGEMIWRGVFEGPRGALIVVVDGVYSNGDGSDPFDVMQGSVWFRPWQTVADTGVNSNACRVDSQGRVDCKNPSGPIARCWNVSLGPYDCRFTVSDDGGTVTSLGNRYNTQQYIKIAEFIDLSRDRTFKETY